jgi:hypothetical protein
MLNRSIFVTTYQRGGGGDITTGLVGFWKMEDNGDDSSGNGYNLTNAGTVTYADGKVGRASSHNGTANAELYTTNATVLGIFDNQNSYSISFWIKPVTFDRRCYIACDGGNSSPYKRAWIFRGWDASLAFERYRSNTMGNVGGVGCMVNKALADNDWAHVCYVYYNSDPAGKVLYPYVNGVECDLITNTGWNTYKSATVSTGSTTRFTVGGNAQNNVPVLNGLLDQVRLYSRVLSKDDVLALYNNGNGI